MKHPDAIVIGAGIVGASCAERLSADGQRVLVLEAEVVGSGATAAGMGHVVVMDDNEAEFALTRYARQLWLECAHQLPAAAEWEPVGTLWVAADDEELDAARGKCAFYRSQGCRADLLSAQDLYRAEPKLRPGLAGGLLVHDDAVTYPPPVAAWLLERARNRGAEVRTGVRVQALEGGTLRLMNGDSLQAGLVVVAAGAASLRLIPGLPLQPRKGHLAITDRAPGFVHHQLVELGYLKSAHGSALESVAFNVQPRATGQLLIGSSRQFGQTGAEIHHALLSRMLQRAIDYLPGLADLSILRTWTGFRAATPDKLPLIGPAPDREQVWLATGHEGLGITTSLATGQILADLVAGRTPGIDPTPYAPARFLSAEDERSSIPEAADVHFH
ncbi:MAG: FAD-binding oxidoreductase [Bryobacterales bacterium]|nr:FAD-binding oxidoreductase [Bryobacterales bacterium]